MVCDGAWAGRCGLHPRLWRVGSVDDIPCAPRLRVAPVQDPGALPGAWLDPAPPWGLRVSVSRVVPRAPWVCRYAPVWSSRTILADPADWRRLAGAMSAPWVLTSLVARSGAC